MFIRNASKFINKVLKIKFHIHPLRSPLRWQITSPCVCSLKMLRSSFRSTWESTINLQIGTKQNTNLTVTHFSQLIYRSLPGHPYHPKCLQFVFPIHSEHRSLLHRTIRAEMEHLHCEKSLVYSKPIEFAHGSRGGNTLLVNSRSGFNKYPTTYP